MKRLNPNAENYASREATRSSNLQMCWSILVLLEWESAMAANDDLIQRLHELSAMMTTIKNSVGQCARELDFLAEMAKSLDRRSAPSELNCVQVGRFTIDRKTYTVSDANHVCKLGNTLSYQLIDLLASEPNRCFSHTQLLASVWDGRRCSANTIRSVVFQLRRRLRQVGLEELALLIRAHGKAYSLSLIDPPRSPQQKSNG